MRIVRKMTQELSQKGDDTENEEIKYGRGGKRRLQKEKGREDESYKWRGEGEEK